MAFVGATQASPLSARMTRGTAWLSTRWCASSGAPVSDLLTATDHTSRFALTIAVRCRRRSQHAMGRNRTCRAATLVYGQGRKRPSIFSTTPGL